MSANQISELRHPIAGITAAILLPLLVFGLGAPIWLGAVGAGAVYGGLLLLLSERRPFEGIDPDKIGDGRLKVLRAALSDTLPALATLELMAGAVKDKDARARIAKIAKSGRAVVAELEQAPEALSSVQRLLTYYIPRAADMAKGYYEMEERGVGAERRAKIADLLVKLDDAIAHFREQLAEQELAALDVDIRLVGEALQEDVGERNARR